MPIDKDNSKRASTINVNPLIAISNNPEIKSKFLSYISLYLENEININTRKNNTLFSEQEFNNLILDFFNGIMKNLTDIENYDNLGLIHDQGFSIALIKIRKFLENKKLLVLKDDYYTEKIFNSGVKFFNSENFNFVNKIVNDFNNIYRDLYKIKISTANENLNKFYIENDTILEQEKNEYIEDFFSFNNLISENIFEFFDYLISKASNAADKLIEGDIEIIGKLVDILIDYCECKNENNALKLNYVGKLSNYVMTFLVNERLNEEKDHIPEVKDILGKLWRFMNNLLKIDESNIITTK